MKPAAPPARPVRSARAGRSEIAAARLRAAVSEELTGPSTGTPVQRAFDDLGTPLSEVTFVVVDLETTGGSAATDGITEVGAVKVRGGQVLGEFQTLVDPGLPIPARITLLTGISQAMVIDAPRIAGVLPTFLEFAGFDRGAVLVAHNARFDVGFLTAAAAEHGHRWPAPPIVDTVALARKVFTRDEVPDHKLATLAGFVGTQTSPDHRALNDARATVEVLHAALERLGTMGVTHLADLATAADPVPARRRRKAHLGDDLTRGPGVYQFLAGDRVLYVGSAIDVRRRVRSYFTAAEKRRRIGEMLDLATAVRQVPCATELEARVRELRLIAQLEPPYNRRSRTPAARPWLTLTDEPHPRLSVVRSPAREHLDRMWGPFSSGAEASAALEAVQEATGVRRCTRRLPLVPTPGASACALAELGRCAAPCRAPEERHPRAADALAGAPLAERALRGEVDVVLGPVRERIAALAAQERYEDARVERDRLLAVLRGARRAERCGPLLRHPEVLAARRREEGGWELVLVRWGRLAGTAVAPRGSDPMSVVDSLRAAGEAVDGRGRIGRDVFPEETGLLADWLDGEGVRLVHLDPFGPPLARPIRGAGPAEHVLGRARTVDPDDPRDPRDSRR